MFRFLSKEEEKTFRSWARENYTPFTEISELWHPAVQDECRRMCAEKQIHFRSDTSDLSEEQIKN